MFWFIWLETYIWKIKDMSIKNQLETTFFAFFFKIKIKIIFMQPNIWLWEFRAPTVNKLQNCFKTFYIDILSAGVLDLEKN